MAAAKLGEIIEKGGKILYYSLLPVCGRLSVLTLFLCTNKRLGAGHLPSAATILFLVPAFGNISLVKSSFRLWGLEKNMRWMRMW